MWPNKNFLEATFSKTWILAYWAKIVTSQNVPDGIFSKFNSSPASQQTCDLAKTLQRQQFQKMNPGLMKIMLNIFKLVHLLFECSIFKDFQYPNHPTTISKNFLWNPTYNNTKTNLKISIFQKKPLINQNLHFTSKPPICSSFDFQTS